MILQVENGYDGRDFKDIFNFHYKVTAKQVVEEVLKTEGCPFEAEVSIDIVGDEEIRAINAETRQIDRVTDVLSFPMVAYETPSDFDSLEEGSVDAFNPENGALMLGSIIINARRVHEQAEAYGHSRKREWGFLIAHSMLHLLGYDHMTADEAKIMEEKQETVLKNLKISREVVK